MDDNAEGKKLESADASRESMAMVEEVTCLTC